MTEPRPSTIAPQWFAVVMGTSIIATASHALPVRLPGLEALAWVAWSMAGALLVLLSLVAAVQWSTRPGSVRAHLLDPEAAPGFGALSMAFTAFAGATIAVAQPAPGAGALAIRVAAALWIVGTAIGVATAVLVPATAFMRHRAASDAASGTWLLPVVPPMVSAAVGALLLPHLHGTAAQTLALACYAMVGAAGLGATVLVVLLWSRLAHHGPGPARTIPSLWLVLGPLGQGVTALGLLADHAGPALGVEPRLLVIAAVALSVPLMGFALMWLAIAATMTAAAARRGLPFSLGWWAFTFPVGTLVTGASSLALHTGAAAATWLAAGLFVALLAGWAVAATGTVRDLRTAAAPALRAARTSGA